MYVHYAYLALVHEAMFSRKSICFFLLANNLNWPSIRVFDIIQTRNKRKPNARRDNMDKPLHNRWYRTLSRKEVWQKWQVAKLGKEWEVTKRQLLMSAPYMPFCFSRIMSRIIPIKPSWANKLGQWRIYYVEKEHYFLAGHSGYSRTCILPWRMADGINGRQCMQKRGSLKIIPRGLEHKQTNTAKYAINITLRPSLLILRK